MGKKSAEIATLIRVQGWSVDEERRMLGQMLGREQALLDDRERMDKELLAEQAVAAAQPVLAGHAYAAYALNHRERRANLETVLAALRVEIEQQRDKLAVAFRELKVLEEVQENWRIKERAEEARLEQVALDEIAQNLYLRQQ